METSGTAHGTGRGWVEHALPRNKSTTSNEARVAGPTKASWGGPLRAVTCRYVPLRVSHRRGGAW